MDLEGIAGEAQALPSGEPCEISGGERFVLALVPAAATDAARRVAERFAGVGQPISEARASHFRAPVGSPPSGMLVAIDTGGMPSTTSIAAIAGPVIAIAARAQTRSLNFSHFRAIPPIVATQSRLQPLFFCE